MKLLERTERWTTCAAVLAFATIACGQPEQWLEYHSSREGRGYRWLELTTNPPPNVALPKLNAQPYFARWTTPLDPAGGRWLCFDRTRKAGPCDRLFFDRSGNGRLDDDPPVEAARRDEYAAHFDPQRVVFKGEDGPVTYHLLLRFMKYDDNTTSLLAESGGWYEGNVNIGGAKRKVQLIDGNVNGAFNDLAVNPSDADRLVVEGDKGGDRYLGRLLELDGQLFQVEVARDGAFIKVRKAENVVLGQVRVPEAISELTAVGDSGHFIRKPAKGEFTLPVGKYRVQGWSINRNDDKGVGWQLSGFNFNDFASFEATTAAPARLDVGEPVRTALQASESKGNVAFSLRLQGRLGETIEIQRAGERPRAPQLLLASRDGSFSVTNTFEYG